MKLLALILSLSLGLASVALAGPKEIPKGSELRSSLFDLARATVEREAGQPVKFVGSLRRLGEWAFFQGTIVNAAGKPIRVGQAESADTALLFKIVDSEWQLITSAVGISDVAYASWPDEFGAPQALVFPEG